MVKNKDDIVAQITELEIEIIRYNKKRVEMEAAHAARLKEFDKLVAKMQPGIVK